MKNDSWDGRIKRATDLAKKEDVVKELLTFYAALLRVQKDTYQYLQSKNWVISGNLEEDLLIFRPQITNLLQAVESHGSQEIAEEARKLSSASDHDLSTMLLDYWHSPSDTQFFAKAFLQPYAQWLAETKTYPRNKGRSATANRCPFCGGAPQLSFLQNEQVTGESGNRDLLCSTCLQSWPFRRVACVNCDEERPEKLCYFQTKDFEHLRIESCDSCRHYLKGIDLTRLGLAVPLVDEVAGAALDLWAHEQGLTKIELNLIGL